jgi:hypothetical protein
MTFKSYKESYAESTEFLDGGSVPARLRATGVPVLAIDGAEDQILDAAAVLEQMATIPGARVDTIEGVGHSPNVEAPEETAAIVLPFVDAGGPVEPLPEAKRPKGGKPQKQQQRGKEPARKKKGGERKDGAGGGDR